MLRKTVRDLGYDTQVYPSSEAYLLSGMSPGCLIVGNSLPGMDSRSLLERLSGTGRLVPFILLGEEEAIGEASEFQVEAVGCFGEAMGAVIQTAFRMAEAASRNVPESTPRLDVLGPTGMLKRRLTRSWQPVEPLEPMASLGVA